MAVAGADGRRPWWLLQLRADGEPFGLQIHNADRIDDEWQQLAVGDGVWADRGRPGGWVVDGWNRT